MSVLLMSSCEDFLDQPIRGQENLDTYFQNETEASKFLSSCYAAICFNDWWQIGKVWNMLRSEERRVGKECPRLCKSQC